MFYEIVKPVPIEFLKSDTLAVIYDVKKMIEMTPCLQAGNIIKSYFKQLTKALCNDLVFANQISECKFLMKLIKHLCTRYVISADKSAFIKMIHFCYMLSVFADDCNSVAKYISQITMLALCDSMNCTKSLTLLFRSVGINDFEHCMNEEHCEETLEYLLQSCLEQEWKTTVLFYIVLHPSASLKYRNRRRPLGLCRWFTHKHVLEFFKTCIEKRRPMAIYMIGFICYNHPTVIEDLLNLGYANELCKIDMEYEQSYRNTLIGIILVTPHHLLPTLTYTRGFLPNLLHIIKQDLEVHPKRTALLNHIYYMCNMCDLYKDYNSTYDITRKENRIVDYLYAKLSPWLEKNRKTYPIYHLIDILESHIIDIIES